MKIFKKTISTINDIRGYSEEMLALMPGHVYWKDKHGVLQGCNNALAKTLGLSSRYEIIGKNDYDIASEAEADAIRAKDFKVLESGIGQTDEEVFTLPSGEKAIYLTERTPVIGAKNEVIGLIGISFDITDRKRAQEEINTLRIAKEAAEAANHAKTEFLNNMRHDLRTPFIGILGFAGVLEADEVDLQKKENLSYIVQSAKTLLNYLNEILEFIHVDNGQLPILEKPFNLHEILREVINMFLPASEVKGIALTLSQDTSLPKYVIGDKSRTQKILINLVSNSIKFTKQGHVSIEANMIKEDNNRIIIAFTISDTGIGIPEDKQNIVFEQFNRLTSAYSGIYPGKGLGLRMVKQLLDEIGGETHLTSEVGKGTVFKILVPYKKPLLEREN